MLPEYKIGLYINPYAKKDAQRVVFPPLEKADTYADFIPIAKKLDKLPDKLVLVGGEGSNRAVMQMMYDRRQFRPVGLVGGGTHDVLYNYLVRSGRVMTLAQFQATPFNEFPERLMYRPGFAKDRTGKGIIFNNQFGIGTFERWVGKLNKGLRMLPQELPIKSRLNEKVREFSRELRIRGSRSIARFPAVVETLIKGDRMSDIYSVSPNIGEIVTFPHQEQFGNLITHAVPEGTIYEQAINSAVVRDSWQKDRIPPENALRVQQGVIFGFNSQEKNIWIDGDTIKNPLHGFVEIARTDTAFPLVAIVDVPKQYANVMPEGTFFAGEYTPERVAAIRRALKKGREFYAHEEIRDKIVMLYRTTDLTQLAIAQFFDPYLANSYPDQAEVAVGYVVRKVVPRKERMRIQSERSRKSLEKNMGGYGTDKYREHQRHAAQARHDKGIPVDTDAMTRGRGYIPWTIEAKELVLLVMIPDPEYQLPDGRPDFGLIAKIINDLYHDNQPVWDAKKVYDMVRYEQRKQTK